MNKYSKSSLKKLDTCHNDLRVIFRTVLETHDNTIIFGRRSKSEQNSLFEKGRAWIDEVWVVINKSKIVTKLSWPHSKHNVLKPSDLSMAVDSAPYLNGRLVNGDKKGDIKQIYYYAGFVMGVAKELFDAGFITHKVRWGGDWDSDTDVNDQSFNDLMHFELIPNK